MPDYLTCSGGTGPSFPYAERNGNRGKLFCGLPRVSFYNVLQESASANSVKLSTSSPSARLSKYSSYALSIVHVRFSGLIIGPKPLINSLHAPSSGRFNLRDLSACRGVVLYTYRAHTDSALTSIPSGAVSFCQEYHGLPVTRFRLLKSSTTSAELSRAVRLIL